MKYFDKLNAADQRAYEGASTAWARYSVLKYNLDKEELAELYGPGDTHKHKSYELVLEDWAPIVEKATGESTGLSHYVGGRPLSEIHKKLSDGIESAGLMIDEYFSVSTDAQLTRHWETWPSNVFRTVCFAVQGGSEGHYVHVDVYTRDQHDPEVKVTTVFLLKTFLGMEHALRLANELTRMIDKAC